MQFIQSIFFSFAFIFFLLQALIYPFYFICFLIHFHQFSYFLLALTAIDSLFLI
jgi:hypothetical protein